MVLEFVLNKSQKAADVMTGYSRAYYHDNTYKIGIFFKFYIRYLFVSQVYEKNLNKNLSYIGTCLFIIINFSF